MSLFSDGHTIGDLFYPKTYICEHCDHAYSEVGWYRDDTGKQAKIRKPAQAGHGKHAQFGWCCDVCEPILKQMVRELEHEERAEATESALVQLADSLAERWHQGVMGKDNRPYIEHPRAVANIVDSPEGRALAAKWGVPVYKAKAAALLHDVIEDCGVTPEMLAAAGIPADVIEGVEGMSRKIDPVTGKKEPYSTFVRRAKRNKISRLGKWADVRHNQDRTRLPAITPKDEANFRKYAKAERELLKEQSTVA